MKKNIFLIIFISCIGFHLTAENLAALISKANSGDDLFRTIEWKEGPAPEQTLLPEDMPGARELRERFLAFRPEITVEQFFTVPLPAAYPAATRNEKRALFTKIVNAFGNPETQEAYTYHSSTRNKDMILFEKSYIADSKGKRLSPFSYTPENLPGQIDYYQYVKEANFSGTVMEQNLIVTDEYLNFRSTNFENMRYTIVRIMGKKEMRSEVLVVPSGGVLCVYYCTQILKEPTVKQVMGITIRLPLMFEKRMTVMAQWMTDQLQQ